MMPSIKLVKGFLQLGAISTGTATRYLFLSHEANSRHCGSRADASESEEYPTYLHIKVKKDIPMKVAKHLLGSICLETGGRSGKTHSKRPQ
jgi:hypothetical protein